MFGVVLLSHASENKSLVNLNGSEQLKRVRTNDGGCAQVRICRLGNQYGFAQMIHEHGNYVSTVGEHDMKMQEGTIEHIGLW